MALNATDPQHDEINLLRLVRRLDKSVAVSSSGAEAWTPSPTLSKEEIWLRALKAMQNVKFARKLLANLEAEEQEEQDQDLQPPPKRLQQRSATRVQLARIEAFLVDVQKATKPEPKIPPPILPTLPVPRAPLTPSHIDAAFDTLAPAPSRIDIDTDAREPPSSSSSAHAQKTKAPPPPGLAITPPDADGDADTEALEISPTLITSALPSLLPSSHPPETATATTSSFARTLGPTPSRRALPSSTSTGTSASTAMHEELSTQLAHMAVQLKRNALHLSASLETDKAVLEGAHAKVEGNYEMMAVQRVRLGERVRGGVRGTCVTLGVVVLVLGVFVVMVGVIRFS